ncbi:MAG: energy-coupled thiamine transporter ThiT [Candidatus Pelethousia sp.]|nr:energy-coupled thiamine transporter ThiT [Candidatus Pelethousia sp.]
MQFVLFEKLAGLQGVEIYLLGAALLVAVGVVVAIFRYHKGMPAKAVSQPKKTRALVYGALCVSLSFVMSYFKLFELPMGGSITLCAMLPVCLYASVFGLRYGLIAGVALGLLQLLQDLYVVHWAQLILDYILAFACYGLAGLFPRKLQLGLAVGALGRLTCSVLSGVIFFAEYAVGWDSVWAYSLAYNGSYIGAEVLLCILVSLIPAVRRALDQVQAA